MHAERRIKAVVEYDGSHFQGFQAAAALRPWHSEPSHTLQAQDGASAEKVRTVQETMEEAVRAITGSSIPAPPRCVS